MSDQNQINQVGAKRFSAKFLAILFIAVAIPAIAWRFVSDPSQGYVLALSRGAVLDQG